MNNKFMKVQFAWILVASLTLISCGGDKQSVVFPGRGGDVFYTYPDAGQGGVSTRTPIIVRLSDPVTDPLQLDDSVIRLMQEGTPIPTDVSVAPGSDDRSIVMRPIEPLATGTTYTVELLNLTTTKGQITLPNDGFSFATALASKGPRAHQVSGDLFAVTRMFPDDNEFPILDFTSLRFQFSQPIDVASVRYGDTLALKDDEDQLVPAVVLAKGHYLTIDPVQDLQPGDSYTLTLSDQLASLYGATLELPFSGSNVFSFSPLPSGPTEVMALKAPASGIQSQLTGQPVNLVPVIATLLGEETQSQQQGDVFAELAFVPNYPVTTPLRIARGSMLTGDELVVRIGGQIPAGFNSGDVVVQFISDATGYLLPNPYSTSPRAPRQIRVFMDVAITTGNPVANSSFNQDVLHLELVGQAIVENGVLVSDALTVVESEVLGLETAFGVLSFRMEAYADQLIAPEPVEDMAPPFIQSWMPDQLAASHRPGEPIVINFNEAVDPVSLTDRITISQDGVPVTPELIRQDGVSVIITLPLEYGSDYDVNLLDGITDLSGNTLAQQTLSFSMPFYAASQPASPVALQAYPGFPCATVARDLANSNAGRCNGGQTTDDRLPLPLMPADRSIQVSFSQVMDPTSIVAGSTFLVEEINATETSIATVDGRLEVRDREIVFTPHQPWSDGALYRYTLRSNGSPSSSACNPGTAICSAAGLPLKTRVLSTSLGNTPALNGGGQDLEIFFRGAPASSSVLTKLSNLPTADVNSNSRRDPGEKNAIDEPEYLKNSARITVTGVGGQVAEANIGCPIGDSCLKDSYVYATGTLGAEVVGFLNADEAAAIARSPLPAEVANGGGILVYLHPTALLTSNFVAYARTTLEPLTTADPTDSGELIMRLRYQCDARTGAAAPSPAESTPLRRCEPGESGFGEGWIVEGVEGPRFLATLNGYIDGPRLNAIARVLGVPIPLSHNQRSYGFTTDVRGDVEFIDDGRMSIALANETPIVVLVSLSAAGVLNADVELTLPMGEVVLNVLSGSVKR
ncbi:Ig-like domain-containing protein [Alcanivorax sp. 1008]|uniref:Ig-like domain-containing protein n=1 Tax=Alcanivorax sp. 1008 TaxID=2816853 RepID=UPI001D5AD90D|nr:Ig-like domain-containing protein [Alcanivorax sp. 1008]MCC1496168.1 Ig-like domain-containing protein [Alcanivorax sp. 1008]